MLSLLVLTGLAQGSGFYTSDHGNRAVGRAGAFVAGADNLEAQFYNPAALTRLQGPQLRLNLAAVDQFIEFDSIDGAAVENEALPFLIPALAFGAPLGDRAAFAFGFYTPHAPTFSYPVNGAQRYALIEASVLETSLGPSFAFQATDWLSVGVGVAWKVLGVTQELALGTEIGATNSNDGLFYSINVDHMSTRLEVWDYFTISGNAGLLITPNERIAIGVSYNPPISYEATGSVVADFSENYLYNEGFIANETATDEAITLPVTLPQAVRFGVQVSPSEALDVEIDVVWHDWSIMEELLVTDVELGFDLLDSAYLQGQGVECSVDDCHLEATDDIPLPTGYRDTISIRLGGEYQIDDRFTARAGALYESSAVPPETLSVNLVDGAKVGYSLGGSARPGAKWGIDFAWAQSFLFPQTITDSQFKEIRIFIDAADITAPPVIGEGPAVGNGDYRSRVWIGSLGVTRYFGSASE